MKCDHCDKEADVIVYTRLIAAPAYYFCEEYFNEYRKKTEDMIRYDILEEEEVDVN